MLVNCFNNKDSLNKTNTIRMNARDLLFTLKEECFRNGCFIEHKTSYKIIQESLQAFSVSKYFVLNAEADEGKQTRASYTIIFLSRNFIHEIHITRDHCYHRVIDILKISEVSIKSDVNLGGYFNISCQNPNALLGCKFSNIRFEEINNFYLELLKMMN